MKKKSEYKFRLSYEKEYDEKLREINLQWIVIIYHMIDIHNQFFIIDSHTNYDSLYYNDKFISFDYRL